MTDLPTYVLDREFNAPREMVWKAWTDPKLLSRWYGPRVETVTHEIDVKPGGLWLLEMKWGGNSHFQRVEYIDVVEPERLVWLHSNADAKWHIAPSPMMADWPLVLLTTVTFEEIDSKTKLRLTWVPHEASEAEISCFASAMENMGRGWDSGMDLLEELLAEMPA